MARANKKIQTLEFKGMTIPVVSVTLRSLQADQLAKSAAELFGDEAFFDGDAGLLELDGVAAPEGSAPDWPGIRALFQRYGLRLIGVRGGDEALAASAAAAGLPGIAAPRRAAHGRNAAAAPPEEPAPPPPEESPAPAPAAPVAAPAPAAVPTLIIDRPMRSGQQAYARGGDLVVLAAVNAGAEVIADGSIHIYAPLRGRALAGAGGDTGARIFTTCFEAELVSIAGVYRTFEAGIPDRLAARPAQVRLTGQGEENRLDILALRTD